MTRLSFDVHGPFTVEVVGGALSVDGFWRGTEAKKLARAVGCYVFALRRPKGTCVPHYVGRTKARFDREVFNRSNLVKFARVLSSAGKQHPVLFLVTTPSAGSKSVRKAINEAEAYLIRAGQNANPNIQNSKGTFRPKWEIPGVVGRTKGKQPSAARAFKKMLL
jgi:hypothetical protein